MNETLQTATFAGGCFWCTEAVFKRLKGVETVMPGYAGGKTDNPSYRQLHEQETGHAESIQVTFDPHTISYDTLLDVFFATHDPTTMNRQGYDQGKEYRSVIFYHTDEQKNAIHAKIEALEKENKFQDPIVTEVLPYTNFYPAEDEHKDYYDNNQNASYCRLIIDPKVKKLLKEFAKDVKDEYK